MAINVKSPAGDLGKGTNSPSRGGTFNGEDGYAKRTGGSGPKERTYEPDMPKGNLTVRTPSQAPTVKKSKD